MPELLALLTFYYSCSTLAIDGHLTQTERFACNASYQDAKRHFAGLSADTPLTPELNQLGYLRFKAWEADNPALVAQLKQRL